MTNRTSEIILVRYGAGFEDMPPRVGRYLEPVMAYEREREE